MPYANRIYRRALDAQFEVVNSYIYESSLGEIAELIAGYEGEKDWDEMDEMILDQIITRLVDEVNEGDDVAVSQTMIDRIVKAYSDRGRTIEVEYTP